MAAVRVFIAMRSQWRVLAGMGGGFYTGFIYEALPQVYKSMGVKKKHRAQVFAALQIMERAGLQVLNKQ